MATSTPRRDRQLRRLRAEGVPLRGGRVDLRRARYRGWWAAGGIE